MPAKVKYFIRSNKKTTESKNEPVNIRIRFHNGTKFDLWATSGKQIIPTFWNNDAGSVRQRADFKNRGEFQKDLNKLKRHILSEYDSEPDKARINKDWLNTTIDKFYNPKKYLPDNYTLFQYIQHFIDNSDKRINPDTGEPVCYKMRREYQVTFNYLKEYAKEYGEPDFKDIDMEFYQLFVDLLRNYNKIDADGNIIKSGLATNTIGKKIQTLKVFLNSATEQGINKYSMYKSKNFKSLSEEVDTIYLTKSELRKLYHFDFSNKPYLERVRDQFIVGCLTGFRYSDLSQIKPERIEGDYIRIKQFKTRGKVVIPISPIVREILNKYDGSLPKAISNQKYNLYLKEAAKLAGLDAIFINSKNVNGMHIEYKEPKHKLIGSHTARRTFCTNAYLDGIPTLSIMAISGHKTERAFLKYIKVDADEHAKKVLKMWQQNGDFLTIAK